MDAMQRYVSKELTHFVGRNLRKEIEDEKRLLDAQYNVLLKILSEKRISYPPHTPYETEEGFKYPTTRSFVLRHRNKLSDNDMIISSMVCFCDIPIGDLGIHINKYSPFGLSFEKSFLIERGASPVFYVEKNSALSSSTRSEYFDMMADIYKKECNSISFLSETRDKNKLESRPRSCLKISGFILELLSYVKFFDNSKPDDSEENFYMEREWRTPYYVNFEINQICRIILPSTYSERFRRDFPEYVGQIMFSDEYTSLMNSQKIK